MTQNVDNSYNVRYNDDREGDTMRKILLLVCITFVVLCYGYPCFILPLGAYSYSETNEVLGEEVTTTYTLEFGFDGKAVASRNKVETEYNYKLKGNRVILSIDEEFGNTDDQELVISSMYKIGETVNPVGMYTAIGVGILAIVLVVTIPKKN